MGKKMQLSLQLLLFLLVAAITKSQRIRLATKLSTLNQARCQAFCITQFPGKSAKNQTTECVNADCRSCLLPCKSNQQKLQDCLQNCASNACNASCQFIAKLGNEASYTEQIGRPGVPIVVSSSFTTLSLSWEKPANVTKEVVVYLVEMSYGGDLVGRWKTLNIITAQTFANVTDFYLCERIPWFYSNIFRSSFNGLYYKFRIVAVTKNSSAARSEESGKIQLQKPKPPRNVSFNILHYNDTRGDKLYFFGKWLPTDGADLYYIRWQHSGSACYQGVLIPREKMRKKQVPNITYNVPHEQRNGCPNTFKVYVLNGCSFSRPASVRVINQGCRHIANYPFKECCRVHPPALKHPKDLIVRNLRRSNLSVTKDFKYSFNITWDSPAYFQQTGCNGIHTGYTILFGDPTKKNPCFFCFGPPWGKFKTLSKVNVFEVNGVEEGSQFKFSINTKGYRLHSLGNKKTQINFTVEPSSEELKVRMLSVMFVTSSTSISSKVFWKEPAFNSGFLKYYLVTYNGKNDTEPANVTNFVIENTQLHSNLQVKVNPVYSHIKFVGIASQIEASPKSNRYKVRNIKKTWKDLPEGQALHVSWEKPISKRNVSYYVVEYEIHKNNSVVVRESGNTTHSYYTIEAGNGGHLKSIVFKVTPKFGSSIVQGATTLSKADFDDKCIVRILSGIREEKQSERCLNGGVCFTRVSKYECKCKKGFTGKICEIEGKFSKVKEIESTRKPKTNKVASTSELSKPQIIGVGVAVGIAALIVIAIMAVTVYRCRKTRGSYTRESFKMNEK